MLKGNTLAIALGALLVGGVATAGFINGRAAFHATIAQAFDHLRVVDDIAYRGDARLG